MTATSRASLVLALQLLAAAALTLRGSATRRIVAWALPLLALQALQVLLWVEVEADEHAGGQGCSSTNSLLSLLVQATMLSIPAWWLFWARRAVDSWCRAIDAAADAEQESALTTDADEHSMEEEPWRAQFFNRAEQEKQTLTMFLRLSVIFLVGCVATAWSCTQAGWWAPFCTTRGARAGEQLWPWLMPPLSAMPAGSSLLDVSAWGARVAAKLSFGGIDALCRLLGTDAVSLAASSTQHAFNGVLAFFYFVLLAQGLQWYRGECDASAWHLRGWLAQLSMVGTAPPTLLAMLLLARLEAAALSCSLGGMVVLGGALLEPPLLAWLDARYQRAAPADHEAPPPPLHPLAAAPRIVLGPRGLVRHFRAALAADAHASTTAQAGFTSNVATNGGWPAAFAATLFIDDKRLAESQTAERDWGRFADTALRMRYLEHR